MKAFATVRLTIRQSRMALGRRRPSAVGATISTVSNLLSTPNHRYRGSDISTPPNTIPNTLPRVGPPPNQNCTQPHVNALSCVLVYNLLYFILMLLVYNYMYI